MGLIGGFSFCDMGAFIYGVLVINRGVVFYKVILVA